MTNKPRIYLRSGMWWCLGKTVGVGMGATPYAAFTDWHARGGMWAKWFSENV